MGLKMIIAVKVSIIHPTINNMILMTINNTYTLLLIEVNECSTIFGTPSTVNILPNTEPVATTIKNEALMAELLELGSIQIDEAIPTRASRYYKRVAVKGVISDVFNEIVNRREVI